MPKDHSALNDRDMSYKLLQLIRACKEGDTIVFDEPNGKVYKIKVEKKYPKNWKHKKIKSNILNKW